MTRFATMFAVAAPLAVCLSLASGPSHAQLGTGSTTIGTGGEALGVRPEGGLPEGHRAAAPRSVGNCITNRTAYRTQENQVATDAPLYATMPNTHFPVTHAAGCLIVDFSAVMWTLVETDRMYVRAWIVGIGTAEPTEAVMGRPAAPGWFETRSMRFVFPGVPAGTHTVRMEWRSEEGTAVTVRGRTLTVQYR